MRGFYSIWTKPSGNKEYYMEDFEMLTMLLSVLCWQKWNGPVRMIADQKALNFLKNKNLLALFQDGYELLEVDEDINPQIFWAAGKLFALRSLTENRAMIDLDLIVWKNLEKQFAAGDICVIHREELSEAVYPPKAYFQMEKDYRFPTGFDWEARPCNTALLYIKDDAFRRTYADEAIHFMKNCKMDTDHLRPMVFAEQRMLAGMASARREKIAAAFPLVQDIGAQETYTHIWGHKNILKFNYEERDRYCRRCLQRLQSMFPKEYASACIMEEFQEYLSEGKD